MLKFLKWLIKSLVFSIVTIFVFNLIGVYINANIPVNIWTILIIGILRIPGLVMILIYNML
ncbi:MAG: pro-sigmaK processing inhibitor BofA family protein [Bacilli bacterium]|nr:pro-sigmaK processing inhibitor BofA family protein [Bacilli bacterium]HHU23750.1 hypothetical protein [Acholeplasmataceae bacterium]